MQVSGMGKAEYPGPDCINHDDLEVSAKIGDLKLRIPSIHQFEARDIPLPPAFAHWFLDYAFGELGNAHAEPEESEVLMYFFFGMVRQYVNAQRRAER